VAVVLAVLAALAASMRPRQCLPKLTRTKMAQSIAANFNNGQVEPLEVVRLAVAQPDSVLEAQVVAMNRPPSNRRVSRRAEVLMPVSVLVLVLVSVLVLSVLPVLVVSVVAAATNLHRSNHHQPVLIVLSFPKQPATRLRPMLPGHAMVQK
jgi:hypothetical protein